MRSPRASAYLLSVQTARARVVIVWNAKQDDLECVNRQVSAHIPDVTNTEIPDRTTTMVRWEKNRRTAYYAGDMQLAEPGQHGSDRERFHQGLSRVTRGREAAARRELMSLKPSHGADIIGGDLRSIVIHLWKVRRPLEVHIHCSVYIYFG